jgi:tetratricopeptide (TPR) repeat protein
MGKIDFPISRRARFLVLALATLLCASGALPVRARAQGADSPLRDGQSFMARKDYKKAQIAFQNAVKAEPRNAQAHRLLGEALFFQNDFRGAVRAYSSAVDLDPRLASAFGARAVAKYMLGDLPGAENDATRAIEIDPSNPSYHSTRGLVRFRQGNLAGAAIDNDEIVRLQPSAQAHFNRGIVRQKLGNNQGAALDFQASLNLDGNHQDAAEARRILVSLGQKSSPKPAQPASSVAPTVSIQNTAPDGFASPGVPAGWVLYKHPGGAFRFSFPAEAILHEKGADERIDAIVWPEARLAIFPRRDAVQGDLTRDFLAKSFPGAPGRQAAMLAKPSSAALVSRFDAKESAMYWHVCLVVGGRSHFITITAPASAPLRDLPMAAKAVLERLEATK